MNERDWMHLKIECDGKRRIIRSTEKELRYIYNCLGGMDKVQSVLVSGIIP